MLLPALAEALGPAETPDDAARYFAVADAVNERVPALAWDLSWNGATWPERKVRRKACVLVERVLVSRPSVAETGGPAQSKRRMRPSQPARESRFRPKRRSNPFMRNVLRDLRPFPAGRRAHPPPRTLALPWVPASARLLRGARNHV
jgi:hypothetical protein